MKQYGHIRPWWVKLVLLWILSLSQRRRTIISTPSMGVFYFHAEINFRCPQRATTAAVSEKWGGLKWILLQRRSTTSVSLVIVKKFDICSLGSLVLQITWQANQSTICCLTPYSVAAVSTRHSINWSSRLFHGPCHWWLGQGSSAGSSGSRGNHAFLTLNHELIAIVLE